MIAGAWEFYTRHCHLSSFTKPRSDQFEHLNCCSLYYKQTSLRSTDKKASRIDYVYKHMWDLQYTFGRSFLGEEQAAIIWQGSNCSYTLPWEWGASKRAGARSKAKIWPGFSCGYTLPWGWVLVQGAGFVGWPPMVFGWPPMVFGNFIRRLQSS